MAWAWAARRAERFRGAGDARGVASSCCCCCCFLPGFASLRRDQGDNQQLVTGPSREAMREVEVEPHRCCLLGLWGLASACLSASARPPSFTAAPGPCRVAASARPKIFSTRVHRCRSSATSTDLRMDRQRNLFSFLMDWWEGRGGSNAKQSSTAQITSAKSALLWGRGDSRVRIHLICQGGRSPLRSFLRRTEGREHDAMIKDESGNRGLRVLACFDLLGDAMGLPCSIDIGSFQRFIRGALRLFLDAFSNSSAALWSVAFRGLVGTTAETLSSTPSFASRAFRASTSPSDIRQPVSCLSESNTGHSQPN
jgi:hypothetical protein